jgi:polyferredoxin
MPALVDACIDLRFPIGSKGLIAGFPAFLLQNSSAMTKVFWSHERKKVLYGGMFLLGVVLCIGLVYQFVQTGGNMPFIRVALRLLTLLFLVVKTFDFYKGYKIHSGTAP